MWLVGGNQPEQEENYRSPYDVIMPHPAVAYDYAKLYSHEDAVKRLKSIMPKDENGYGQFCDIEASYFDKSIYKKTAEENIEEAHPPLSQNKNCIDYSFAKKYAPKLAKNYKSKLEDAKKDINKRYFDR